MAGTNGSDARATVAVIGTGIMGSAMARNLAAAGLDTRVWDRSASATGPLAEAGAMVAASARDAVQGEGVVITMLPIAEVVDSVIFDGGVDARCSTSSAASRVVAAGAGRGGVVGASLRRVSR